MRPLGTLHLTLGVMSFHTKERLDEALAFFQSLDLTALMREAERVATEKREKRNRRGQLPASTSDHAENESKPYNSANWKGSEPLTISLESLYALPRAKSATVLHASPIDPTERLYPFCLMLRDKFLEAGFMLAESKLPHPGGVKDMQNGQQDIAGETQLDVASPEGVTTPPNDNLQRENSSLDGDQVLPQRTEPPPGLEPMDSDLPKDPYKAALARKPKPRPLLLHATILNTIYVRGRQKPHLKDKKPIRRIEFDARSILARYRDYYVDETRMTPRAENNTSVQSTKPESGEADATSVSSPDEDGDVENKHKHPRNPPSPRYPYVWAKQIPLDRVCICEMGARKLPLDGEAEDQELNARLGDEYTIVAQRELDFSTKS